MISNRRFLLATSFVIVMFVLLAACGGGDSAAPAGEGEEAASAERRSGVPTMPAANFESVGAQSAITQTGGITTTGDAAETGPDLALGERVYTNRCAECHGAQAEGGSAAALAGLGMDEAAFTDLIRTGGDIGNEHLFGTRAVSENGLAAMYAWLQALQ